MARFYNTKDGDMLDEICWKVYGRRSGRVTERVLDANPGLADVGPKLPAGLTLTLPDIEPQSEELSSVRLWD